MENGSNGLRVKALLGSKLRILSKQIFAFCGEMILVLLK